MLGRRLEGPPGEGQLLQGISTLCASVVARERLLRLGRRGAQVVGVGQSLDLGSQGQVLTRSRRDRLDLVQPQPEQLGLAAAFVRLGSELLQGLAHVAPLRPQGAEPLPQHQHRLSGVAVQCLPLVRALQQSLLVALAVDGQDRLADLAQHPDRHTVATHVGPRPPIGADRAAHQQRVVVEVGARLDRPLQRRVVRGQHQPTFHCGAVTARPHPAGVGATTEQQGQSLHDHRLAGAGLTGDHRQPRGELENGLLDDAEAPDPQLLQHTATLTGGSDARGAVVGRRARRPTGRRGRASRRRRGRTSRPACR